MEIRRITQHRRDFLPLLLLADEQEDVIEGYLTRGELYALYDPDLRAACVLTDEGDGTFALQNIAVLPEYRRRGYGSRLVAHIADCCGGRAAALTLGTGDTPMTLSFYRRCGFTESHRIENYMLTRYDHPIFEDGVQLLDRVCFRMDLRDGRGADAGGPGSGTEEP